MLKGKKESGKKIEAEQEERCVLCGKPTGISKDIPVKERKYYIETAGQLCAVCYEEIYMPLHNDNILKL